MITRANVGEMGLENWPRYRKKVTTAAIRVQGPFEVETSEGIVRCEDGYLAVDSRGYPYPIAAKEFEQIYDMDGYKDRPPGEETT